MPSVFGAAAIPFIGCIALLAAAIMTVLAFASPYWATDEENGNSFGLWRKARCDPGTTGPDRQDCAHWDFPWYGEDWQHATRGLESLSIIFYAIPLVVLPVYIYGALGLYYRCLLGFMTLFVLLGTICNIAGVVVFGIQIGAHDQWKFDWCLIVCIVGGALGLIAFIILLIATINKPDFVQDTTYLSSGFYVDPDKNRLYAIETEDPVKIVYAQPPPPSEPPMATKQLVVPHSEPVVDAGHVNPVMVDDD